jgi:hypothetical protein
MYENFASERGTTNSIINLARALRDYLGFEVAYCVSKEHERSNVPQVIENIENEFEVIWFEGQREFDAKYSRSGFEYFYNQKTGHLDSAYSRELRNLNHVVFQEYEPHGHRYAYISQGLAEQMMDKVRFKKLYGLRSAFASSLRLGLHTRSVGDTIGAVGQYFTCENSAGFEFVPYCVPRHEDFEISLRGELGIPNSAFVIGSLSGESEFNLKFVHREIDYFLENNPDAYFIGPNIPKFTSNPRAIWLPRITSATVKQHYINTLDVFVHGRERGETFGLAIAEFLAAGKPVLSWSGGVDTNHVTMLEGTGGLYADARGFRDALSHFRDSPPSRGSQMSLVEQFRPGDVARKFKSVFLD